jgi:hypothetical protein
MWEAQIREPWSRTALGCKARPYLKNYPCKNSWWSGSNSRVPACQLRQSEFNPTTTTKKKKKEEKERGYMFVEIGYKMYIFIKTLCYPINMYNHYFYMSAKNLKSKKVKCT